MGVVKAFFVTISFLDPPTILDFLFLAFHFQLFKYFPVAFSKSKFMSF